MKLIKKTEIQVHITTRSCFVTGPAKVCSELMDMGAKRSVKNFDGSYKNAWAFPLEMAPKISDWYDKLPDDIYVAYHVDKKEFSRMEPKQPRKKREYNPPTGIQTSVGKFFITSPGKRTPQRAFQIIGKEDGEAIVREVVIRDGVPVKDEWKYNDYRVSTDAKRIDGRPLKVYKP